LLLAPLSPLHCCSCRCARSHGADAVTCSVSSHAVAAAATHCCCCYRRSHRQPSRYLKHHHWPILACAFHRKRAERPALPTQQLPPLLQQATPPKRPLGRHTTALRKMKQFSNAAWGGLAPCGRCRRSDIQRQPASIAAAAAFNLTPETTRQTANHTGFPPNLCHCWKLLRSWIRLSDKPHSEYVGRH
jgi:hypothetical protein